MQDSFQIEGLSQAVSPAKTSRSRANAPVLPGNAPGYIGKLYDLWTNCNPNISSSKMYPVFSQVTPDGTLELSSKKWPTGGTVSHGVCLTLNISESPSDAVECSLSGVLETENVPARYSLSAKACEGILRRASRRGKSLPPALEKALMEVVRSYSQTEKGKQGAVKGL